MAGLIKKVTTTAAPPLPAQYSENWRNLVRLMLTKEAGQRPSAKQLLEMPCLQVREGYEALIRARLGIRDRGAEQEIHAHYRTCLLFASCNGPCIPACVPPCGHTSCSKVAVKLKARFSSATVHTASITHAKHQLQPPTMRPSETWFSGCCFLLCPAGGHQACA